MTQREKEKIKRLVDRAGGARVVAATIDQIGNKTYDAYHNAMRGRSTNYEAVQKMIDAAKGIIANQPKAVTI